MVLYNNKKYVMAMLCTYWFVSPFLNDFQSVFLSVVELGALVTAHSARFLQQLIQNYVRGKICEYHICF